MRYRLRTLLIALALGPPLLAGYVHTDVLGYVHTDALCDSPGLSDTSGAVDYAALAGAFSASY